jgi:hypothetical protein
MKYLSPVLRDQPDSGDRGRGWKMHVACHRLDCTGEIVDAAFDSWADMTGAANGTTRGRVGRTHA